MREFLRGKGQTFEKVFPFPLKLPILFQNFLNGKGRLFA
jgi:hypothetical protein